MRATVEEGLLAASPSRAPGTELHWRQQGSQQVAILKNRNRGGYHRLSAGSAWVWALCDGQRTVSAIAEHIASRGGPSDATSTIESVRRLAAEGLIEGVAVEAPPMAGAERGFAASCRRILTWRMTITGVDPLLTRFYHYIGCVVFTRVVQALCFTLMATGFVAFVSMWLSNSRHFSDLSVRWALLLPLFFYSSVMLHEVAHAMTTKHFGREVNCVGFGWFWLGPFFYVDTSDMWLAGRRERVLVGLAGAASDLTIAGICAIVALAAPAPISMVAFGASTTLYLVVVGNMSPMLEFDGYYILADLLHRPNLRRQSLSRLFKILRARPISWRQFGEDKIASGYAIGSMCYILFLLAINFRFNHYFFMRVFHGMPGSWPSVLSWLVTVNLLMIFAFGLISDVRRSVPNSSR